MRLSSMGLLFSALGASFGAVSCTEYMNENNSMDFCFNGKHPKKQNKLSQKAKRKRARQKSK